MAMTPLERKAALRSVATLKQMTLGQTARHLAVSYNHLMLVIAGERVPGAALKQRIAAFLEMPIGRLFEGTPGADPPPPLPPPPAPAPPRM
jgi:transcriptional regulator with XRE-family HTH domain